MSNKRYKKVRIAVKPIGGAAMKSRKLARKVTSKFHKLQKERQVAESLTDKAEKRRELDRIQRSLEEFGGIQKYQEASVISTKHFSTSKWVVQRLRQLHRLPAPSPLTTLEVGAINDQLLTRHDLSVRAIDLHSQLPSIEECDFLTLTPVFGYEVIVCSMVAVINCVFHPCKRAEMILRLLTHLRPGGVLFLILPTRCLNTAQMRGQDDFKSLLAALGLECLSEIHTTPHLTFYTLTPSPAWERSRQPSMSWGDAIRNFLSLHPLPDTLRSRFTTASESSTPETPDFSLLLESSWCQLKAPKRQATKQKQ